MSEHEIRGKLAARELDQMMMVSEEKDLCLSREFRQGVEGCRCSIIVEAQEDVIDDERNRLM